MLTMCSIRYNWKGFVREGKRILYCTRPMTKLLLDFVTGRPEALAVTGIEKIEIAPFQVSNRTLTRRSIRTENVCGMCISEREASLPKP